tara:strand:- start:46631 stop:46801 length:171 start_codon:yes stop_codon:yes gene_type:complete
MLDKLNNIQKLLVFIIIAVLLGDSVLPYSIVGNSGEIVGYIVVMCAIAIFFTGSKK